VVEERSPDAEVVVLGIGGGVFGNATRDLKVRAEPPGAVQLWPELVAGVLSGKARRASGEQAQENQRF